MLCRLAVDMGLGSIVRVSWDFISMSTATDYLVSLTHQLRCPSCDTLGLLCPCRPTGLLHTHLTTRALYQCCSSVFLIIWAASAVKQLRHS